MWHLERNAPTATRQSFSILLQTHASKNKASKGRWSLATADVKAAFLQGDSGKRRERLFMRPPKDLILEKAGAFDGAILLEITGNVYGLPSAPWNFTRHVITKMLVLRFKSHSLDVLHFLFYPDSGELACQCLFHVDDALISWSFDFFDIKLLKNLFEWGKWCVLSADSPLTWERARDGRTWRL